ncbi:hypothetical protein BJX99DRAFT_21552 [Aspergillus californicus]
MQCNVINNPGFESGLDSWYSSATPNAIRVLTDQATYDGSSVLGVTTTSENPEVRFTQDLYWLDDEKTHNLTVQVRLRDPPPTGGACTISAYLSDEWTDETSIAGGFTTSSDFWNTVTGTVQPTERDTVLNILTYCSFDAEVLFDDVVFSDC